MHATNLDEDGLYAGRRRLNENPTPEGLMKNLALTIAVLFPI
jgi:hypothetical protein